MNLAPLEYFDVQSLCNPEQNGRHKADRLITALALIYNDLKDIEAWAYANESLKSPELESPKNLAQFGEYNGVATHILRLRVATVHELLQVLKEEEELLKDRLFKQAVSHLASNRRKAWNSLQGLAVGSLKTKPNDEFHKFLLLARNNVASHYSRKQLSTGIRFHFDNLDTDIKFRRVGYLCRGNNLEASRFFFADAAAQGYFDMNNGRVHVHKLHDYIRVLSETLRFLVCSYLEVRKLKFHKYKSSAETLKFIEESER